MDKKAFDSIPGMGFQKLVRFVFSLTQAEGLITGTMVKMFTIALSGDRLRHRGERGVRFGAAGLYGG